MKKKWVEPEILVQQFVANEYVAACYKIRCTTPDDNSKFYYLYDDTNNNGKWDKGDQILYSREGGFVGCNKWHKGVIRNEAPTENGFVTRGTNLKKYQPYAVFWWNEDLGATSDYHVMTPGKESYETTPND